MCTMTARAAHQARTDHPLWQDHQHAFGHDHHVEGTAAGEDVGVEVATVEEIGDSIDGRCPGQGRLAAPVPGPSLTTLALLLGRPPGEVADTVGENRRRAVGGALAIARTAVIVGAAAESVGARRWITLGWLQNGNGLGQVYPVG
jgi:hypothetical protein